LIWLCYLLLSQLPILAADVTWTGTNNTTWSQNPNWTGGAPGAGDNAVFNSTFTNQPNLDKNQTFGGIWMTGSVGQNVTVAVTGGSVMTINGNTINGTAGLGILIDNANAFSLTINAPIKIGNAQSWLNNSANLLTVGAINLNNKAFTIGGSGNTTVTGVMSGAGAFTKAGAGTLTLSGTNTYTGGSTINGGTVVINSAASFGATAGGVSLNAATVEVTTGFSTSRIYTLGSSSSTFQVDPSQTFTVTGAIAGTGTLNKTGTGTMVLGASNTYTLGTNVVAGTLQINANDRLANSGTLTVSGGTFDLQTFTDTVAGVTLSSGSITGTGAGALTGSSFTLQSGSVSAILAGAGALTKSTSGTVTLSGASTYSGGTSINGGILAVTSSGALGSSGTISFNGGTLQFSVGNTTDYSGRFSNALNQSYKVDTNNQSVTLATALTSSGGTFTKVGSGTLILSGANSYTGATTVSGGTLQLNVNNALGTSAGGTTVAAGAAVKLNGINYSTAEGLTLNGSGVGGAGALTNTGTSTFAGAINIATNATISAGGGTLNLTGGIAKNGTTLTLAGGGTININTNGITGSSANSDLVVDGTTVVLNTANSYNGPTTVQNSGILQLGASNVLPSSPQTDMTVNTSSAFDMASFSDGVASLAGDSTGTVKNSVASSTSTLTVNPTTGVSTTFAGVIAGTNGGAQGNMALVKSGAGTLVLTGTNTFSGSTTINGGTLTAAAGGGNSALGATTAITVNTGGTLLLGASDQINNSATMTLAGGTLSKGNFSEGDTGTTGIGALTLTATGSHIDFGTGTVGILTFASLNANSFTLTIDNWSGNYNTAGSGSTDRLIFDSDQSTNLGNFSFTGYGAGAVEFSLGSGYWEVVAAVPEPSTWVTAALVSALMTWQACRRLRRSRQTTPNAAG
jgi:fibronectin-binding autotransporter adhesin